MKNLVSKSATRPYPIQVRPGFKDARGELANKINDCTICGICAKKCPSQCITVDRKEKTWEFDPFACVYCGICSEVCPKNCIVHYAEHKKPVRLKTNLILKKDESPKLKVMAETV